MMSLQYKDLYDLINRRVDLTHTTGWSAWTPCIYAAWRGRRGTGINQKLVIYENFRAACSTRAICAEKGRVSQKGRLRRKPVLRRKSEAGRDTGMQKRMRMLLI